MLPLAELTALPGASLAGYVSARRAVASWTGGARSGSDVRARPRGRGPVVLVGGFCTTDVVLEPMRRWLDRLGYQVVTRTLNTGMGCGTRSVEEVRATVHRAARLGEQDDGVHVVGYSRGGQFARVLATDPDSGIRSLVTLGSPFDPFRVGLVAAVPALAVIAAGTLGLPNLATSSCLVGSCCAEYRAACATRCRCRSHRSTAGRTGSSRGGPRWTTTRATSRSPGRTSTWSSPGRRDRPSRGRSPATHGPPEPVGVATGGFAGSRPGSPGQARSGTAETVTTRTDVPDDRARFPHLRRHRDERAAPGRVHAAHRPQLPAPRAAGAPGLRVGVEAAHEPELLPATLPPLDAVVLSHLHGDHFDRVAQRWLPAELPVVTTRHAARALRRRGSRGATGLETWQTWEATRGEETLRVTAVPAQHGPAVVHRALPPVMGSVIDLERSGRRLLRVYVTGDTLCRPWLREVRDRLPGIDVIVAHLGGTRVLGVLVTMDGRQGADLAELVGPGVTVPVHCDDYPVFRSPRSDFEAEMAARGLRLRTVERGSTIPLGDA